MLSNSLYNHQRQVENFYDVFSDIGGFKDVLFSVSFCYFILFYNDLAFENHVTSNIEIDTQTATKQNRNVSSKLQSLSEKLMSNENLRL